MDNQLLKNNDGEFCYQLPDKFKCNKTGNKVCQNRSLSFPNCFKCIQ